MAKKELLYDTKIKVLTYIQSFRYFPDKETDSMSPYRLVVKFC